MAVDLLTEILDHRDRLEPVATLADILINPSFESALEARFVEAFRRRSGTDPGIRIQQDVVRGKAGWRLRVDDQAYTIEPQVDLGPADGVSVCSRPDFLIRPARAAQPCLPVAVFTDGFGYHKQDLTADTLKRLALVQSERFLVWSLTWQDLDDALSGTDGGLRPLPPSGTGPFDAPAAKVAAALGADGLLPVLVRPPFEQLITWLRRPQQTLWSAAVFARALSWASPDLDTPAVTETRAWISELAPTPVRQRIEALGPALCGEVRLGEDGTGPTLRWLLPGTALKPPAPAELIASLLLDPAAAKDEKALREAWRRFLAGANLVQFLPCAPAMTIEGTATGVYEQVQWARLNPTAGPATGPTLALGVSAWQSVIAEAVGEAGPGLTRLMEQGVPAPVVGFELQGDDGAILAEAELAWEGARLVVLRPDQQDQADAWQAAGWPVVILGENWEQQVARHVTGFPKP